jgi:sec-independent protein translocase protein TatB
VFGLSFGELCVLMVVAIVVIGPKDMPKVLRKAGQLAAKLRRMASDVRTQSGIDEVLRADGLHEDIAEIRKLAQADFLAPTARPSTRAELPADGELVGSREKEYPRDGADAYGAVPDTAFLYANNSSASPLARDPLYVAGDADAVLPDAPAAIDAAEEAPSQAASASAPSPEAPGAGGPS